MEASPVTGESDEPETHDLPGFIETPAAKDKFTRLVPVYSLEAAAGLWGPESSPEEIGWAEAPGTAIKPGMFIARVRGQVPPLHGRPSGSMKSNLFPATS